MSRDLACVLAAKAFYNQGFRSVSRKFRTIARVPPGGLGRRYRAMVKEMGRERAEEQYRRVHASGDNKITLDPETYRAFMDRAWESL